ncbi:DUF2062 domain-containing protein [Exilibacterium tricleocarpae]|uniref:DUF2062 domain-containing protein n=1 Tax=Exilibacterium tricleocarpae TaxID=2591008 RepID=A0A545U6R5_9GAMM|nr:DUF2062 domain-containing protein [Exilibacterium tricleocarpae]TQV85166.1 DUF2062 domain-containing protein [Exilibacterium tricleocarpae]
MYLRVMVARYFKRWIGRNVLRLFRRHNREPVYFARASLIGLFLALTPTVGIQIPMLVLIWGLVRRFLPRWDFSLALASAWTLVSNVVTLPFLYYVFLLTGRLLLGDYDRLRPFQRFQERLSATLPENAGLLETLWVYTLNLISSVGLPLFVGSLPWAILGAWIGYHWTLRFVHRLRARSASRRMLKPLREPVGRDSDAGE